MKSEKGITLISIIVYMIGIILVISILASLSNFFFQNKNYLLENDRYISEYNKFNMYFINDVKNNKTAEIETIYQKDASGNEVISDGNKVEAGMRIILADGTVYTYRSKTDKASDGSENDDYGIYRNKAKICTKISSCTFSIDPASNKLDREDGKRVISVTMEIDNFTTTNDYVLKYW